jgi:hypothetical protein
MFELVTRWAVRPLDLLREVRKLKPSVVHFCGRGSNGERGNARQRADACQDMVGEGHSMGGGVPCGLFFQGPNGQPQLVSTTALQETFCAVGASAKLVVLNACYSELLANALLAHVGCVVGVGGSIQDDAARRFSIGFYGGLGERQSIAAAYKQGCAAISLDGLSNGERPQLKARADIDADQVILADPVSTKNLDKMASDEPALHRPSWTLYGTVESAEAGVVSVLATVEALVASVVYMWIACQFGTLHLTISAIIAPLLLLRTEHSVSRGLRWLEHNYEISSLEEERPKQPLNYKSLNMPQSGMAAWIVRHGIIPLVMPLVIFIMAPITVIIAAWAPSIIVRVTSTAITFIMEPLKSITAVPRNWWRSVACLDSCCLPEVVPGAYRRYGKRRFGVAPMLRAIADPTRGSIAMLRHWRTFVATAGRLERFSTYSLAPALGMLFVLAIVYRWSLKGSALIYSPLIWIVHSSTARSLRDHLQDIHELVIYRVARRVGLIVLALFAFKLCVWHSSLQNEIFGNKFVRAVFMPDAFPAWQIASAANAVLAWALYFAADWVLAYWKRGVRINDWAIEQTLRWLSLGRGILSVYTISCCIYLAASLSGRFGLPRMGTGLLPWR